MTLQESLAALLANRRANRRGGPDITNVLQILPPHLLAEVMGDAAEIVKILPRWIPVTESLPDDEQEVLFRYLGKDGEIVHQLGALIADEGGWVPNYAGAPIPWPVTHWRIVDDPED